MKATSIYKCRKLLLFVKNAKYIDGWVRQTPNILEMNEEQPKENLTATLIKYLNLYEEGLELEQKGAFRKSLLRKSKCKSYKQFVKESSIIEVCQTEKNEYKIQPLVTAKTFKGFESYKGLNLDFTEEDLLDHTLITSILDLFKEMEEAK